MFPLVPFFLYFFFLPPYYCSRGFEACCPHFQQMMQLHEQRIKLKLSLQSNTRQWCLHISQNTTETHVHPHKYNVHVRACTHNGVHSMRYTLFQSTHWLSYQSHCFSFSPSCPINKTTHNSLQHIIKIERRYYQLLYASTDTSLASKSNLKVLVMSGSLLSLFKNPRIQGDTLPSCERKKGRLAESNNRQMEDLPA